MKWIHVSDDDCLIAEQFHGANESLTSLNRRACFALNQMTDLIVASAWRLSALLLGAVIVSVSATAQDVETPGTSLGIASVPNLRDVGGYTTVDGSVVRRGVAYRSNQLNPVTADDMKKIAALGLKNDFDLRTAEEREAKPDELPAGVKNVWLNVLADAKGVSAAEVEKLLNDPKAANEALGGGKAAAAMAKNYREIITLPSANAAFRQLFVELGDKNQLPSLYHCTTGKDRTGWASAALLTLLGVPEGKVYEDFLRSNEYILPAYKSYIEHFVAAGGDPSIPRDLLGVKADYLRAAFDQVTSQYGNIENYFDKGLGIDAAGQEKIRDRFLQTRK
jgi:protein-tyrosine phosphatase